ncbi:PREDICTED: uncharacterized protein LOC108567787 [Nicrophorus vespilloides]|uniref:Uncharacterized protein LOC108567787 n=1 Tax=Nicrophorus vespilloides TaxID=110193 RepID=A0ABM1NAU5_NICVS|nr:PREDICTED: uncharacterized protein LOC108567787 [Nicrophorus vespilloides]XP_017783946.1 PREDICTED: uncharacterized protein LOC108567787 [Nicrophorus vespilloides]XP_017783947.1 PREDICTED: uncharacterized protein LOC108567787 [Nicrophorus vespilloides]XP_017783948.1 PREDICTED: uncharacterized protein LOC108567787 [Nicrophorus vespilloides]
MRYRLNFYCRKNKLKTLTKMLKFLSKFSLSCKLFVISIITIAEGIYQIVLITKASVKYKHEDMCTHKYEKFQDAVTHFAYFYRVSECGDIRLRFFLESISSLNNNLRTFLQNVTKLSHNPTKIANFTYVYFTIATILDMFMILFNIPIFTASFCTEQINLCKQIFIPWVIVMTAIITFDLITIPIIFRILYGSQYASRWVLMLGFSHKYVERFTLKHTKFNAELVHHLTNFPHRLMYISFRHIVSLPLFILFMFIICKELHYHYKQSKMRKMNQITSNV